MPKGGPMSFLLKKGWHPGEPSRFRIQRRELCACRSSLSQHDGRNRVTRAWQSPRCEAVARHALHAAQSSAAPPLLPRPCLHLAFTAAAPKNLERVWKKEQEAESEKKRVDELR